MPQFNGDVIFLDGSGQVRATNGSLTLRGDDTGTKSVIIGSGMSLRPEKDVGIDLGRPDLRWHRLHTGDFLATSGSVTGSFDWGAGCVVEGSVDWQASTSINSVGVSFINGASLSLDAFTDLDVFCPGDYWDIQFFRAGINMRGASEIATTLQRQNSIGSQDLEFRQLYVASGMLNTLMPLTSGTSINIGGSFLPEKNAFYSLGTSAFRWGTAHAASGIFNMLSPSSSGTFIGLDDVDIIPLGNARRAIGSLTQRLARSHVASGIFNTIGAPTSGTFLESAASLLPNRNNIYSLGTTGSRWANLFASSGTIANLASNNIATSAFSASSVSTAAVTTDSLIVNVDATIGDLTVNRNLVLDGDSDGGNVIQNGPITWDTAGNTLDFTGSQVSFGVGVNIAGGLIVDTATTTTLEVVSNSSLTGTVSTRNILPFSDRLYAIGTSALRYSRVHAASGILNTISPPTSGTFVNVIGSLVPERDAIYSLGTSVLRWGNLFAASGTVNTLVGADITATTSLNAFGSFGVLGLAVFNGGTFFGNAAAPSIDASYPFGLQGFRWANLYAASGTIETLNPLPSGGIITINGSFAPELDLLRGLGTSNRRWAAVYAGSGVWTTGATIKGAPVVTNKDARTTVHAVITANSGAIISNTNEVDIYNYTVPGNTLSPSGKLQLECVGSLTNMTAAAVNMTPRVYVDGTQIWGDLFSVSQGPRPADFCLYADICALGSLTGQRVRGSVELATRTAASTAGNGDFGALNGGQGNWSSAAASGTANFANPVVVRVTMQLGTSNTNISYSGFQCVLTHTPFPGV